MVYSGGKDGGGEVERWMVRVLSVVLGVCERRDFFVPFECIN